MTRPTMPNEYPVAPFSTPVPRALDSSIVDELASFGVPVDVSDSARADHGRDWWPLSIPDVAAGRVPHWPGAVVRPRSTAQVSQVVELASRYLLPITAQGGRSGVVGGAVAPDGGIALDLTGLDRIIGVDEQSGTVTVEAGVFGPDLESHVRQLGWTVGHYPQSFALATVGGWIACRGAGQFSNRYGKIEDLVRSLTVVLANGDVVHLGSGAPRQAVGPDLLQLFIGSEGALGVVTEATLVMQRRPDFERRGAFSFDTFAAGLEACRAILQRGARPAVLRLYDEIESRRNFEIDGCALIVLDEGDRLLVDAAMTVVNQECADARVLDGDLVATWLAHRNDVGALAPLWTSGYVVDTIEVAGPWVALVPMHQRVTAALAAIPEMLSVSAHQSHAYSDGACLYFTFAGRPSGDITDYYRTAWNVATNEVLACGGALSHHHGVGRNRARFVTAALGTAFPILEGIKNVLDPNNVMNPGVLGLGHDPW